MAQKILIIEDDVVLGDVLLQKIRASGYQAELVREGVQGFSRIGEWLPDLVIVDISLPLMNGFEILEQKSKNTNIAHIPTIVLTESLHPINGNDVEKMGATAFLVKSDVMPSDVILNIKKILGSQPAGNSVAGKRILLVEDDEFLGSILTTRLKGRGAEVLCLKNGEEAVEVLKKDPYDALLLDILLPGMSGFDVLEIIRSNQATSTLPVAVVSNFNQVKDIERAKAMNAKFFVKALVNPDEIINEVEKMLLSK